jgi:hypothetical protein
MLSAFGQYSRGKNQILQIREPFLAGNRPNTAIRYSSLKGFSSPVKQKKFIDAKGVFNLM